MDEDIVQIDPPEKDFMHIKTPVDMPVERQTKVVIFQWLIGNVKLHIPEMEEFLETIDLNKIVSVTSWGLDMMNYTQIIYQVEEENAS